jgi:hypothetical protein
MKKDFGIIFWIHLVLVIAVWMSPLWADWKLISIGVILFSLQYLIMGGCYLTFLETGEYKDATFYYHYLSRVFPKLNKRQTKIFVTYILPVILLIIAYVIQTKFGWIPLIGL